MAESRPQRMLLANGNFVTEGMVEESGHGDEDVVDDSLRPNHNMGSDVVPQHLIQPSLDHSYVNSFENSRYVTTETDDSRDGESSDGAITSDKIGEYPSYVDDIVADFTQADQDLFLDVPPSPPVLVDHVNVSPTVQVNPSNNPSLTALLSSGTLNDRHPKLVPPLGSVDNPIQIVQQGNAYRSSQLLTKQHLQQIAHVLQKQQLAKAIQNGGKSVLYDQNTNTRIVYRVIYPSELQAKDKTGAENSGMKSAVGPARTSLKTKRPVGSGGEEERTKPLLSKEEREEKKKHRPRTRSGRISKPPSYMVKDYKRIHHLDFNEEPYDDSDGGYSDYHVSDEEKEKHLKKNSGATESTIPKKRNYSCMSCSKAYIGKGGLSRHYRLNPTHGSLQEGEDVSTQDENSNSSLASSVFSASGTATHMTYNVSPSAKTDCDSVLQQSSLSLQDFLGSRRKNKLKEILKSYRDDELIELVMPRLLHSMSIWDLLLAKSRKENSLQLDVQGLFGNFELLVKQMQKVTKNFLSSTAAARDSCKMLIHVTNDSMAHALRVNTGTYFVKDIKSYHFDPLHSYATKRRDLETRISNLISQEDMIIPSKFRKLHVLETSGIEEPINATLPDQILSDVQEVDGIELNLPSVDFGGNVPLQTHDPSQLLNVIPENLDNQVFTSQAFLECSNGIIPSHRILNVTGNSTTVTPSSLSSGCLSAVDASEALRTHNFISATVVPQLDNVQLNEVPLFSSALASFQNEASVASLQFPNDANLKFGSSITNAIESQIISTDSNRSLLAFNNENKLITNPPLSEVQSLTNSAMFCSEIQGNSTIDFSGDAAVSLLQGNTTDMTIVPGCLDNTSAVDDRLSVADAAAVNRVVGLRNISGLTESDSQTFESVGKCNNMVSFDDVDTTKSLDFDPSIRHLLLPDRQVLETWPNLQNTTDLEHDEQMAQEGLSSENLVVVQNPDGSFQVPDDQIVPLETLQALLNANQVILSVPKGNSSSHLL